MSLKGEAMTHRHIQAALIVSAALTLVACTSGDNKAKTVVTTPPTVAATSTTSPSVTTPPTAAATAAAISAPAPSTAAVTAAPTTAAPTTAAITGPAPGVTADTIKIGVTFVDTAALKKVGLDFNLGDHKAVYQALADDINKNGGINGRKLQLEFAAIDPSNPQSAEETCVKMSDDDHVFAAIGFFLADAVICPVSTHSTAVIGGDITADRQSKAKAPWISPAADDLVLKQVLSAFKDKGVLGGKVAVYTYVSDKATLDTIVMPGLKDLGVTPVDFAVGDAPNNDTAALAAQIKTFAQRFKAAGADTVLLVGGSGANWPTAMADDASYRPKLLFTAGNAIKAFATSAATTNFDVLNGSLVAGPYGPDQAIFDEPEMQKCVAILTAAGLKTPAPNSTSGKQSDQPYQAAFQACPDMALLKAWLNAAGTNLNYGTLDAVLKTGLKIAVPGDPVARAYGPSPANDGDPKRYIFHWDAAKKDTVIDQ
jgi:ABC-type branched-subunit amino acid transport system substrate-binding protein